MLEGVVLIFGASVFAFLVWLLYQSLDDEDHLPLKLFLLVMFLIALMQVARVTLNTETQCEVLVQNATVNGSTTNYDYTRNCFSTGDNTGLTLWRLIHWILRVAGIYAVIFALKYYFWDSFKKHWNAVFGRGKKR